MSLVVSATNKIRRTLKERMAEVWYNVDTYLSLGWCRLGDSNSHGLATTAVQVLRVCQFHQGGTETGRSGTVGRLSVLYATPSMFYLATAISLRTICARGNPAILQN